MLGGMEIKMFEEICIIIKSIITILSVGANIYFFTEKIKTRVVKYRLKAVLSISERDVHILTSENLDKDNNINITFEQACSASYISTLFRMVDKDIEIQSLSTHAEHKKDCSEICIGGPLDNVLTDSYISIYFKDFETMVTSEKLKKYPHNHQSKITESSDFQGFHINNSRYKFEVSNNEIDYFVLIKLDQDDLGKNRSVIIIFGYTRKGLLCGTRFLYNNYLKLYQKYKNKHFFIVGKCFIPSMDFIGTDIHDITETMFTREENRK